MTCPEVLQSLSDYLDDDLDEEAADEIDLHLSGCPPCQAFLNTLQRTVEFCRDTTVAPLPAERKASLLESVKLAMETGPDRKSSRKKP
jgi:anti-sigma factor RsiW